MHFEYDPERLIEEVKRRPGLWDADCMDYRNKNVRQSLWTEVVRELNSSTTKATKCELKELEIQLQKKWKSIRDCYIKYLTNPKNTKRPYIYSRQLQFLSKVQKRGAENNSDSDEDKKSRWVLKKISRINKNDSDGEDEQEHLQERQTHEDSEDETLVHLANNSAGDCYSAAASQFAFANVETIQKPDDNDPDRLFLLSLLPHLKKVPEHNRLNAKMEMMAVLQNAQYK